MPVAMLMLWKLYFAEAHSILLLDLIFACQLSDVIAGVFVCYYYIMGNIWIGRSGALISVFNLWFQFPPKILYTSNV
jgi:hypothetical protein